MNHAATHTTHSAAPVGAADTMNRESTLTVYQPLILVASFIVGVAALVEVRSGEFSFMRSMDNFMAGFFIFFSFFKFLNLTAFADAFSTYDIVAKRWRGYALAYPFVELALGVSFALGLFPVATNIVTVVLMSVGSYGVWLVLKRKGTIECACLGTIFKLPMTKITLFENALMMTMALVALVVHFS